MIFSFFFFNDTATTEIYTLSLHTLFRSLTEEKIENKTRQVLKVIDKIEKLYQLALKQAVKLENTPKAQKRGYLRARYALARTRIQMSQLEIGRASCRERV